MALKKVISKISNKLIRVAIYIRVSTDRQAATGDSMDEQLDTLQNYINSSDNMICVGIYIDDGISGQKLNRGDFHRLICDVKCDRIDLIIFTKLDRWFRSLKHYLNTQDILDAHGCNWLAVSQPYFDTSTPHGRAFIAQSMTFAELEAQNDSARILDVFNYKYKQGQVLSGKTALGFSIVNKKLQPNDDAHKTRAIFEYYARTGSLNQTIAFMETEFNIYMSVANLKKSILTNAKYIGVFRDNTNYCPRIIDDELFYTVQRLLSLNVKADQKYSYVFSGLLRCASCGHSYYGFTHNVKKKDKSYKYPGYRCHGAFPSKHCPNRKIVFEKTLEKYMLENIKPAIQEYIAEYEIKTTPVVNNATKRATIEKKLQRLKNLYLNEEIEMDEYKEDKAKLLQQLDNLDDAQEEIKDLTAIRDFLKMDIESIYWNLEPAEKRTLWRSVVDRIEVDENKNFRIIFL